MIRAFVFSPKDATLDPHFSRILHSPRKCRCCGSTFEQLLSLSCDRPDICPEDLVAQDNSAILAEPGDVLTDDFCRLGDLFFVRAILALPIAESGGAEFVLGTWASLSPEDFDIYLNMFELQDSERLDARPVWLANSIPPGEGTPVACMLVMREDAQYPELDVSEPSHPLYRLQNEGTQFEELLELLHTYGHDVPSLVYDS